MVLIFARSSIAPSKSFSPHMRYTRSTLQHVPATLPRTFLFFPSGARLVRLTKSDPTNIAEPMAALLATESNFTAPERNTHHTLLGPLTRFQILALSSPCLTWHLVALYGTSQSKSSKPSAFTSHACNTFRQLHVFSLSRPLLFFHIRPASLKHNMVPSCTGHQPWFSSSLAAALHHQRASHHTCVTHVALCNMCQQPCHALSCSFPRGPVSSD